jgi:hypothetical protein
MGNSPMAINSFDHGVNPTIGRGVSLALSWLPHVELDS